jgi:hypothetical protein
LSRISFSVWISFDLAGAGFMVFNLREIKQFSASV